MASPASLSARRCLALVFFKQRDFLKRACKRPQARAAASRGARSRWSCKTFARPARAAEGPAGSGAVGAAAAAGETRRRRAGVSDISPLQPMPPRRASAASARPWTAVSPPRCCAPWRAPRAGSTPTLRRVHLVQDDAGYDGLPARAEAQARHLARRATAGARQQPCTRWRAVRHARRRCRGSRTRCASWWRRSSWRRTSASCSGAAAVPLKHLYRCVEKC